MKSVLLPTPRNRWVCLSALLATIVLGLSTRETSINWPAFVSVHAGDALWTLALYLGLGFLFPRLTALFLFVLALGISWGVELSQLLDWSWFAALRETLVGRLLLGTGFQWFDFPRYTVGALLAFGIDLLWLVRAEEDE